MATSITSTDCKALKGTLPCSDAPAHFSIVIWHKLQQFIPKLVARVILDCMYIWMLFTYILNFPFMDTKHLHSQSFWWLILLLYFAQVWTSALKLDYMCCAGSGKTTTLVRYTQMRPDLKFLLIVFNKYVFCFWPSFVRSFWSCSLQNRWVPCNCLLLPWNTAVCSAVALEHSNLLCCCLGTPQFDLLLPWNTAIWSAVALLHNLICCCLGIQHNLICCCLGTQHSLICSLCHFVWLPLP